MLDHLVMAGLVLVFALVLGWMLVTVATGGDPERPAVSCRPEFGKLLLILTTR